MKHISPHTFFFLFFSVLYGMPLLLTLFFDINSEMPYVRDLILADYKKTRFSVLVIYIISIISFLLGSWLVNTSLKRKIQFNNIPFAENLRNRYRLSSLQRLIIQIFIVFGFGIVIQMYRSGAFTNYLESFDASWIAHNIYTVLCEFYLFIFIYLWINYNGYRSLKWLLVILIFITILKGSRMFVIPLACVYIYKNLYVDGQDISKILKKMLLFGLLLLCGLFFMFFFRHDASLNEEEIGSTLLLLIQYETCGVHIPLMKEILLEWHTAWNPMVALISDITLFLIPRFVWENKNDSLYFDNQINEYSLSPYGGINGEASVIIYFGILYPLFFFLLGALCCYIYKLTQTQKYEWVKPLYIYGCSSLMFTFLRNGVLNASKNMITLLIVFFIMEWARRIVICSGKNRI